MNCPHVVWALRQRGLSAPERVVLMYLADKANSLLVCWPSIETISLATELSDKTVRRAIQRLVELRLIRIEARRRHTHHYYLLRPTNGIDGDPLQPAVDVERSEIPANTPVERSEIPTNVSVERSEIPAKPVERSGLPAIVTGQPSRDRSDLPLNPPSWPVILGAYPPKKESPKEGKCGRAGARRPTPLPPDWQPTRAVVDEGLGLGLTGTGIERAVVRMRALATAGGWRKADWDAYFLFWLREDAEGTWQRSKPTKDTMPWQLREILAETRQ